MFRIDERVWFLWACWLLLLPLKCVAAAAAAACVHEAFHFIVLLLCRGVVHRITITPFGAVIEAEGITGFSEVLCILAGPAASFALLCLIRKYPLLGLCGLIQGGFNLLPIYPLDGGRALMHLLKYFVPLHAEEISCFIGIAVLLVLMVIVLYGSFRYSLGVFPVIFCFFWLGNSLLRKRP